MCGGGGGQTSNSLNFQNSTSTYTPNPYALSMMYGAMSGAQNLYLAPFQQYEGQRISGYNQDQLAAMQGVRNMQGVTQPYFDTAGQLASNAVNYANPANFSQANVGQYFNPLMSGFLNNTPMTFSQGAVSQYSNPMLNPYIDNMPLDYSQQAIDRYKDPTLQRYLQNAPMDFSAENVNKYYNPYQESVINATQNRLEQQERQQQANLMAQQARSGSFGGNRSALNRAYLSGQQGLNRENILSGLQQQGYNQALGAFQQQQAQALAIAQAEQQRAQAMYQQQQGLGYKAREDQYTQGLNQFNQQQTAALNAAQQGYAQALAQYNAQQQQAINANQQGAYNFAQLGNQAQQAELQGLQALFGSGSLQQQMEQQNLNQAYEDWAVQQAWPYQQLAAYANLAAGIAPLTGGTTNTSSVGWGQNQQQGGGGGAAGAAMGVAGLFAKMIPGLGSFLPSGAARGGRINRANGGGFGGLTSNITENPQAIDLYTGVSPPASQYTDLSGYAYPTDPAFNTSLYEQGLGAVLSPAEQNEILEEKWKSKPVETEYVDLEPFEYKRIDSDEEDRPHKAGGGGLGDLKVPEVTSAFEANPLLRRKESPYGDHGNPLIAAARKDIPKPAKPVIPQHLTQASTKAPEIPTGGAPGGVGKAMGDLGSSLGELGKAKKASPGIAPPEAPEFPASTTASDVVPLPPERPADLGSEKPETPSSDSGFGPLGSLFKDFGLSHGGVARDHFADGGTPRSSASYQDEINALATPTPRPIVPSEAFRNYGQATGQTVGQAWGPRGLGLPTTQQQQDYKLPWKTTNQGSSAYNQNLLAASRYIRPTQMTPFELGFQSNPEEGPYYGQRKILYSPDYVEKAGSWGQGQGAAPAIQLGMLSGNTGMAMIAAGQQAQQEAQAAAQKGDWKAYNAALLKMPRTPSGYVWKFTGRIQPDGTLEKIPVRPTYQPLFNRGGAVRSERKHGGRKVSSDPWGKLAGYGDDIKSAALALKEDAMHPLEVMQSIINRARSGVFPGGSDPSSIMAAKRQYEPMNPSNRGTSHDPRLVNPNDPKVLDLAKKYHELQEGKLDTGIGTSTNFLNPDIVRGRRHLHGYEQAGINDEASKRVGKQIFYTPAEARDTFTPIPPRRPESFEPEAAQEPYRSDYFKNLPPPRPYGPGDQSILAGGQGKYGDPILPEPEKPLPPFSNADVSGGIMNMPKGFAEAYPLADKPMGTLADLSPAPTGAAEFGITHNFEKGVPELGFMNKGHPDVAEGYAAPDNTPDRFAQIPPMEGLEPSADEWSQPAPGFSQEAVASETPKAPVSHHGMKSHASPHHGMKSHPGVSAAAPEQGGFDLSGLFGDEHPGQGGFDLGDMFKDVELDLPNFDIGSLFNRGGAVREGYREGGSPKSDRAKEAWDYLINQAHATPAEAEVIIPAAAAESGFNPEAIHDEGTGYGLFGHRLERRDALKKALGPDASDFFKQLEYGLKDFRGRPEHRFVEGENPSIDQIMQAHGAFERPAGYKEGHPEGMLNYAGRRALTEALASGDFGAFGKYQGNAGGGGGGISSDAVASDAAAPAGLKGLIADNKDSINDIGDFLMASGFGAMASRNPSTLGAIGEGGLRGIEALNAGRALRNTQFMQQLQAQNLMSEVAKRNFETGEAIRQAQERRNIASGKPSAARKAAPTAPKITGDAGTIFVPNEGPVQVAQQGQPPAQQNQPSAQPTASPNTVASDQAPRVMPQEDLSRNAPPEYQAGQIESKIQEAEAEAADAQQKAEQSRQSGLLQDAKDYEAQAKGASEKAKGLREEARKARETPFPIAGEDLKKDYEATQASGRAAQDRIANLRRLQELSKDPEVYQGFEGENILEAKKAVRALEDRFPGLKPYTEDWGMSPSRQGIARSEQLQSEASRNLKDELGSLGNGTSNKDVDLAMKTQAGLKNSPEGNQILFAQKIRIAERQQEIAEFQRRYIAARGGLDANYNTALQKWANEHPMFDQNGLPTKSTLSQGGSDKSEGKTVVRTGKDASGRSVVKYSDGTVGYAD